MNQRVRVLKDFKPGVGPVVYWMSRDQRVRDNWALILAQQIAIENRIPLGVVFCLVPEFLGATLRHYDFLLQGLEELESDLQKKRIPFFLICGKPEEQLPRFVRKCKAGVLITDFSPLRLNRQWKQSVASHVSIPFYEVDAHNIVPCWVTSSKQEYAARTIRPKIHKLLSQFLTSYPNVKSHPFTWLGEKASTNWKKARGSLRVDTNVDSVNWLQPGEKSARKVLRTFLKSRISVYDSDRNHPDKQGQSDLSPYLHFGQISAQRIALEVQKISGNRKSVEAFLEESIVRRELSDNFCYYNPNYDSFSGFPTWAQKTLNEHRNDRREHIYNRKQFEKARTHDDLWNAAQIEMVQTGKMHGYMRMYWAKKILEWSPSPEEALSTAIYLNDRYELDGRDPNGYTGIAWSIGGVHDRPWFERPIFGKIRYMSYGGCKSKFNIRSYIEGASSR